MVYKDRNLWHWRCRRWLCEAADHAPRQEYALARGLAHLDRHGKAGFSR